MRKTIITIITAVIVTTLVNIWFTKHDEKVMETAEQYEDCVRAEYGVSPAHWYAENGEYPICTQD